MLLKYLELSILQTLNVIEKVCQLDKSDYKDYKKNYKLTVKIQDFSFNFMNSQVSMRMNLVNGL